MDCQQAANLINAGIDDELDASGRLELDSHLAACAECRATREATLAQDALLRRAFAARRLAAATIAERVAETIVNQPRPARRRFGLFELLCASAAGFLLAIALLRPWLRWEPAARRLAMPIAEVTLATGPVEVLPPAAAESEWSSFTCPIVPGASVRTQSALCELSTADGSELRLNCQTQLKFDSPRKLRLDRGQVWSHAAGDEPIEIESPDASISARGAKFDLACPSGETVLQVIEGSARIRAPKFDQTVHTGERVKIVDGTITERTGLNGIHGTDWLTDILVLKGPDNPELNERVNDLLARIGESKLSLLNEDEIRRLGNACVLPLIRFIQSADATREPSKRALAARIAADVAEPRDIPELIDLLSDDDGQVRGSAATALARLTRQDHGRSPSQWEQDPEIACEETHKAWMTWWENNKDRYPRAAAPLRKN